MSDAECIFYGLIGTAVMEQLPMPPPLGFVGAFADAHDMWAAAMKRGVVYRWRCESSRGPAGLRVTARLA